VADHARYVVLGSGPAGTRGSETLRKRDRKARVVVVSDDPYPFYNRILLSKSFLESDDLSPEDVVIKPAEVHAAQGIELRTQTRVLRLDPDAREIELSHGKSLTYDMCLIATGASPIRLPIPGIDLPGVVVLRTLDDAVALRVAASGAKRAVIIGGGLVGVEVAAALTKRGVSCTLLALESWLFGHLAPKSVGGALEAIMRSGGVTLELEAAAETIDRDDDRLLVRTTDGREFSADLVPVGVGVKPNVEFLKGTALVDHAGVHVDAYLRTKTPDLYAAGDVATYEDRLMGTRHRVEHWLHAQHQGRHAAENMIAEEPTPYQRVSSYDTELFGVSVVVVGAPELVTDWTTGDDFRDGKDLAIGECDGRVVAAFSIGGVDIAAITRRIEVGE
jgi:NADPH-dependent 2,4-dienoyl-CoA reductase/sulfur reductase-like enzyme